MNWHDPEAVKSSVDFLRSCVEATPLRRYVDLLDAEDSALARSLQDGLRSFEADAARYRLQPESVEGLFENLLLAPNAQAVYFYRISRSMFLNKLARVPDVLAAVGRQLTGLEIYYSADIGPGFKVIHGAGTVIGAMSKIGSNFTVYQGVTVGDKLGRDTGIDKRPVIEDDVIASAGSTIIGPVRIGSMTLIGANARVIDSMPGRCIAAGVPARVKAKDLSDEAFDEYRKALKG